MFKCHVVCLQDISDYFLWAFSNSNHCIWQCKAHSSARETALLAIFTGQTKLKPMKLSWGKNRNVVWPRHQFQAVKTTSQSKLFCYNQFQKKHPLHGVQQEVVWIQLWTSYTIRQVPSANTHWDSISGPEGSNFLEILICCIVWHNQEWWICVTQPVMLVNERHPPPLVRQPLKRNMKLSQWIFGWTSYNCAPEFYRTLWPCGNNLTKYLFKAIEAKKIVRPHKPVHWRWIHSCKQLQSHLITLCT